MGPLSADWSNNSFKAEEGSGLRGRSRQDSNLCTWLRRPALYPLSYGSVVAKCNRLPAKVGEAKRLDRNGRESSTI